LAKNLEATITELGFTDSLSWSSQSASAPDTNVAHYPRLMYYYHPDYLGHVEYITDLDGLPYQHFYYTAWGETLIEEKATRPGMNFDSPYRFNGKELDEETGLYYYGARYYNPTVSVWLGVDPKAQWYPNKSPYNFSGNNPAMIIDPNGKWEQDVDGNWVAQKGDSWWSLHKDAGISWSDAKKIAGNFNQNRGVDNWKTVRVGDAVSVGNKEVSKMPVATIPTGPTLGKNEIGGMDVPFRVGSLGLGLNFEITIPGIATSDGNPWGYGQSINLMADAENNLEVFSTQKEATSVDIKNTFGMSLNLQFTFTTPIGNNAAPLNRNLIGYGEEWGAGAGPLGYSQGINDKATYRSHTIPVGPGGSIDFSLTRWKTKTKKIL
jgi:RHS repeat-associated protein